MIASFRDKDTTRLFDRQASPRFSAIRDVAYRKLVQIDRAASVLDLAAIPGNRFEKLKGDRVGQYSIRINDQFRICFRWDHGKAYDVEVVDYH